MATPITARPAQTALAKIEGQYRLYAATRFGKFGLRAVVLVTAATLVSSGLLAGGSWKGWLNFAARLVWNFLLALVVFAYPLSRRASLIRRPPASHPKRSVLTLLYANFTSFDFLLNHVFVPAAFVLLFTKAVDIASSSPQLGWLQTTRRHPWNLNERVAFLFWGNIAFFIFVGLRDQIKFRSGTTWPNGRMPLHVAASKSLTAALWAVLEDFTPVFGSGITTLSFPFIWTAVYRLCSRRVWAAVYRLFSGWTPVGSLIHTWAWSSKTQVTWSLAGYLLVVQFVSFSLWKILQKVGDTYITHPFDFAPLLRGSSLAPDTYLLTALQSSNSYDLHFTLMELMRVARIPARRQAIFGDLSTQPVFVHQLFEALLLQLGKRYTTISTRGGLRPAVKAAAPVKPSGPDPRALQVKQADIFRPTVKANSAIGSTLQNVLDGPVIAPPAWAAKVDPSVVAPKMLGQVEGVASGAVKMIEGKPYGDRVVVEGRGFLKSLYAWTGREWARNNVATCLPDPMAISWIVDVLTVFTVASADEDAYGRVQAVLPATLEAIVRVRIALRQLEAELLAQATILGKAAESANVEVKRAIGQVVSDCDESVLKIARRFGKSLGAFRFPPGIAEELKEICRPLERVEE